MDITLESKRCLGCLRPLCQEGCPNGNHIRDVIAFFKNGQIEEAATLLWETNPFPELTSRLCDYARQCEGHCVRGKAGNPIAIHEIEKEISLRASWRWEVSPDCGKKVAIIGGGIAGMSAALFLRKAGVQVDLFEKENHLGGAIYTGIPRLRFDQKYLDQAIEKVLSSGVNVHLGEKVNTLPKDYDAILLCLGASKENFAGMTAMKGYVGSLDLLYDLNVKKDSSPYAKAKNVYIWGGGNVAMDAARSLNALGKNVTVIYRRSRNEMPANASEIDEAEKEGVKFAFLTNVKAMHSDEDGNLSSLDIVKMGLGEKDESGRASFFEIPGSESSLSCDLLVAAIGQKVEVPSFAIDQTSLYAAGDYHLGPKNVASAIADGRERAKEILEEIIK